MFVYAMIDKTNPNASKIGVSNNPERREGEVGYVKTYGRYRVASRRDANLIESMAKAFAIRKYGRAYTEGSERLGFYSDGYTEFFNAPIKAAMGFILKALMMFRELGYDALRSYRRKFTRVNNIRI